MAESLAGLEPRSLWGRFAELAAIPRPSKHEERVVAWIRSLADEHGFATATDAAGNLLLRVPATRGRGAAPPVVLQAHLDMVCEKNKGVAHDFERDPIQPQIVGEWVRATDTTLGADNGIGVAAALAAATDPAIEHGPLELLFTLDEETGLTGARDLDPDLVRGRLLLNLDSEEDGTLFVGCAGGADAHLELPVARRAPAPESVAFRLAVEGLRGGHSGLNIAENRANAVKLMTRLLLCANEDGADFELAAFDGGDKHNAIPREAEAIVTVPRQRRAPLERVLERCRRDFGRELAGIDDGLSLALAPAEPPTTVLAPADRDRLLWLLAVLPHGVLAMSRDMPGLVETSSNVAAVRTASRALRVTTSSRANVDSAREAVIQAIVCAGRLAGARVEASDGYPGWKPRMDSPLLEVLRGVFREIWGEAARVTAVHAGLECALLGQKIAGIDMISFGPQIEGAHSPDERVHIPSVERFWRALGRALDVLASQA